MRSADYFKKRKSSMLDTLQKLSGTTGYFRSFQDTANNNEKDSYHGNRKRSMFPSTRSGGKRSGSKLDRLQVMDNKRESFKKKLSGVSSKGSLRRVSTRLSVGTTTGNTTPISNRSYKFRMAGRRSIGLPGNKAGRFRRVSKFILLLRRLWNFHLLRVSNDVNSRSSLDNIPVDDHKEGTSLLFDVTLYKANKEIRLSSDAKRILSTRPATRTSDELQHVQTSLQNYKSLAEYPVKMQEKIAENAWIEQYGPKRVILREGHIPMSFYFILKGSVVVTQLVPEQGRPRLVNVLTKGDSFGELAIKSHTRRTATIITKDDVEFLCLSRRDYENVFLSGGLRSLNDPFLQKLKYLKEWPLDILQDNPKKVNINFYKRGTVIVENSNETEWIYIIKSGSCSILKKLSQQSAKENQHKASLTHHRKSLRNLSRAESLELRLHIEDEKLKSDNQGFYQLSLPQLNIATRKTYRKHLFTEQVEPKSENLSRLQSPLQYQSSPSPIRSGEPDTKPESGHLNKYKRLPRIPSKGPYLSVTPGTAFFNSIQEVHDVPKQPPAVFVTIKTLIKGNIFGLASLMYENEPSLSLVSNGVECIMINKKFYLDYAPPSLVNRLRNEIYPYPSDKELQSKLETRVSWDKHKQYVIMNMARQRALKRINMDDSRANIRLSLDTFRY